MNPSRSLLAPALTANVSRAAAKGLYTSTATTAGLRISYAAVRPFHVGSHRNFSVSHKAQLDFFPPPKNLPNIKLTYVDIII